MRYTIPISALTDFDRGLPWKVNPRLPDWYELPPWARDALARHEPTPEPYPPQDEARAVRYQDNANYWVSPPALVAAVWYPVAVFTVPSGLWGKIVRVETHVFAEAAGGLLNRPTDPLLLQRALTKPVHFRLMVQSLVSAPPQPHPWGALAGVPLPYIGSWSDNRFAWNRNEGNTQILVPERRRVVMYAGIDPLIEIIPEEIGGRLVGYTAAYDGNPFAIEATRLA